MFFLCDHNSKNAIANENRINVNDTSPIRDHSDDEYITTNRGKLQPAVIDANDT
jgi:hypothetical protein